MVTDGDRTLACGCTLAAPRTPCRGSANKNKNACDWCSLRYLPQGMFRGTGDEACRERSREPA